MAVENRRVRLPKNPAIYPIHFCSLNFYVIEISPLKLRAGQIDCQVPAWIVQRLNGNPVLVFPIAVTVGEIPLLQPSKIIGAHDRSLPASS